MITLTPLTGEASATLLTIGTVEILFSYQTPVAYRKTTGGWITTSKKYSQTTSKHISQNAPGAIMIDSLEFARNIKEILGK